MKAKLNLVIAPHSILLKKCQPIKEVTQKHKLLAAQMMQLMKQHRGVGLAAPQVARLIRLIVIDTTHNKDGVRRVLINPEILSKSDTVAENPEGCLSYPGIFKLITRPIEVTVKFLDINGTEQTETFTGLAAQAVQHEIDHLSGKLFEELK